MSGWRELLLVVSACGVAYGTGLGDVAFYTRGEPREGLVVQEMRRSGVWLVPRRPEGEVARKPPLYYWLAAPVAGALPDAPELALRLPSAVLGAVGVVATWGVARAVAGPTAALPAALVLATTFEWTRAASSARVDMTLASGLTLVLCAWLLVLAGHDRRWLVLAGAGATMAALAKGPVAIAVPALAALAYAAWQRDRGVLGRLGVVPVLGAATVAAGCWYLAAFAEQGQAFLDVVLKENVVRFIDTDDAKTGHAHGMLYLPLVGLVGLLPWVPLLPLGRPRRDEPLAFAALWGFVVVVFFSVANAKRSVYLLPAFPAFALVAGAGVARGGTALARGLAVAYGPAFLLLATAGAALAAGLDPGLLFRHWLKPDDAHGATAVAAAAQADAPFFLATALATLAGAVVVERARRTAEWRRLVLVVAALAVAWTATFGGIVHPAVARTRSVRAFMTGVGRIVPVDAALHTPLPADPGLRFYAPRPLVRLVLAGTDAPRHLVVWEDDWRRLRDATGAPLRSLAVSEASQSRRGHLVLAVAPAGSLSRVPAPPATDAGSGLRTGNRSP